MKYTLIKVLTGVYQRDAGPAELDSKNVSSRSPLEADSAGISTVYQEVNLVGTLGCVLIFGTIQSVVIFDGRLNSWWMRIAIRVLLLIFILLQRQLSRLAANRKACTERLTP